MMLGDILEELDKFEENTKVKISDGSYIRDEFGSDRGDYYDMYIGRSENKDKINTIKELKDLFYKALKKGVMTGYKGGEFDIDDSTFVRIGCYGCSGDLITNIVEREEIVYLVFERPMEVWDI
ncbi:hypothetical protein GNF86_02070 [Clostridium perfringens]